MKTRRPPMIDQLARYKPESSVSNVTGLSMCECAGGCVNGDAPVDDTFFVHCRLSKNACKVNNDCVTACSNCCSLYGLKDLAGPTVCAENVGTCFVGVPEKCAAV
jgi:hypothetical protein